MLNKINLFKTRVIYDNKVHLTVKDAAKALGYENIDDFIRENDRFIVMLEGMPELILETDFNSLLLENAEALRKIQHIEITKVDTLRCETEMRKSIYPLKLMFTSSYFEEKAIKAGFSTIEEYIEKVDYPQEIHEALDKLRKCAEAVKCYDEYKGKLLNSEYIDHQLLEKYGLKIQSYTRIKDGHAYLETFIVGKGIFYMMNFNGDEFYTELELIDGELYIPEYEYEKDEVVCKKVGVDPFGRDYRKYSVFENIFYVLTNKKICDAGVDLLECIDAGVKLFISNTEAFKLFNPNMFRDVFLFEGIINLHGEQYLTNFLE